MKAKFHTKIDDFRVFGVRCFIHVALEVSINLLYFSHKLWVIG